jgi:hypothetical protein
MFYPAKQQLNSVKRVELMIIIKTNLPITSMANNEKKKRKLEERINFLENELLEALTKKTSNCKEINVADYQRKIFDLKAELIKI